MLFGLAIDGIDGSLGNMLIMAARLCERIGRSQYVLDGGLPRLDRVEQLSTAAPDERRTDPARRAPEGFRCVATQACGWRCQGEPAFFDLGEDADAGEGAQPIIRQGDCNRDGLLLGKAPWSDVTWRNCYRLW